MKFTVKFPDGRAETCVHSADTVESLAVSGFGKSLVELQAEGYELTPVDETTAETAAESGAESTGGAGGSNESSTT